MPATVVKPPRSPALPQKEALRRDPHLYESLQTLEQFAQQAAGWMAQQSSSVADAIAAAIGGIPAPTPPAPSPIGVTVLYDSGVLAVDTALIDTGDGGIAGGHSVLDIHMLIRTDETAGNSPLACLFNNDSGANYDRQYLYGTTSASAGATAGQTSVAGLQATGASATANYFSYIRITVPFYAETTAYKQLHTSSGQNPSVGEILLTATTYKSTTAISRFSVGVIAGGKKLKAGSHVLILGVD